MSGQPPGNAGLRRRRSAVVVGLLGAVLLIIGPSRPWLGTISGDRIVPGLTALGYVVGAAIVALTLADRVGRAIAAGALVLAGTASAVLTAVALTDLPGAAAKALVPGVSPGRLGSLDPHGIWPVASLAGSALAVCAGIAVVLFGAGWSEPRRIRGGAPEPDQTSAGGAGRPAGAHPHRTGSGRRGTDDWERLSRGEDPTRDEG